MDRVNRAIEAHWPEVDGESKLALYQSPLGRSLEEHRSRLRAQLGSLSKQYVALGIEERQTRLFENWSNILLPLLMSAFDDPDIELTRKQKHKLPEVLERHLRVLERPSALADGI